VRDGLVFRAKVSGALFKRESMRRLVEQSDVEHVHEQWEVSYFRRR